MNHFKDYIPKAFPHGNDLILDSEVLMVDTKTSKPLPFGTLGVHKVMKIVIGGQVFGENFFQWDWGGYVIRKIISRC